MSAELRVASCESGGKPARMLRVWTSEEMARLGELVAVGASDADIAAELGRSLHAVACRKQRLQLGPKVDRWGRPTGKGEKRWWTRERVIAGLADFAAKNRGPLPGASGDYSALKAGHDEWPVAARVLEYFGTMADAWGAVPGTKGRYARGWVPWTEEDDDYLLSHAGDQTLKIIAKALGRTWSACKRRLYDLQAGRARDVSGYMSALQVAKEYGCPADRVSKLIASGELKAHKVQGGHYWRIDPADAEAIASKLRAPRVTQKRRPLDTGDYRRRYGLRRTVGPDGKLVEVAANVGGQRHLDEKAARRREREQIVRLTRQLEAAGLVVDVRREVAS